MDYIQLSFFPIAEDEGNSDKKDTSSSQNSGEKNQNISERLKNEFDITTLPFLGCDFDHIYPRIAEIMPGEQVTFDSFGQNGLVMAEIVCVSICHQMNWDYLRSALFDKLKEDSSWFFPDRLTCIEEKEVADLFRSYNKPERIRAKERTKILREVGEWAKSFIPISSIFLDSSGSLLPKDVIRGNLLSCNTFAMDVEEKKMQLLLQKLSLYKVFKGLSAYCQPAIDYHLIRTYLRRGLLFAKTEYAKGYIMNQSAERKDSTVAAVRHLCSELMLDICIYTDLDVNTINQIEWHIGRSICLQEKPDCNLEERESQWLRPYFSSCPFSSTCAAKRVNSDLLEMKEPVYKGSSY